MSMSLDGFVADANDGVGEVFDWYMTSGDVEFSTGGSDPMTFRVSPQSAEHLRALWAELGALITGRRTFEVADGWGGNHAWGPAFVLTHEIPAGWPRPGSSVHFVTDGGDAGLSRRSESRRGGRCHAPALRGAQGVNASSDRARFISSIAPTVSRIPALAPLFPASLPSPSPRPRPAFRSPARTSRRPTAGAGAHMSHGR